MRIVTSAIEHPATLQPCQYLARFGVQVTILPVDRQGVVSMGALRQALQAPGGVGLVTIMHANNEVGTLQPIREISRLAHQAGALVHCDAAQSVGKVPVDVQALGVDLLSIAGHKLYAPKGVGALYVRRGVTLEPLIHGAGHESGRRAGTVNVPYVVGLGAAAEHALEHLSEEAERMRQMRDRLWQHLQARLGERIVLNGHPTERLPNTLNVSFRSWVGSEVLARTPAIAASTGSACHEGQITISPVLKAMGIDPAIAQGAVRLSVGRLTTTDEVDRAAAALCQTVETVVPGECGV